MIFIQIIIPLDITLIVTEIPNGIYFIENKETAKCIDIQNQVMADGTQIHQWGFHGGKIKHKVLINEAICYLVFCGLTDEQYIKTGTHELGHALGFFGDITDDICIMTQGIVPIHTLTNKDKLHLQQVYN